jgi:hypothetical protein
MKGFLVNIFAPKKYKIMFKNIQKCLKGKKSYLAGGILVLQGLAKIIDTFAGFDSLGQFVDWIGTALQSDGMQTIVGGLAVFGIRAGIGKVKDTK